MSWFNKKAYANLGDVDKTLSSIKDFERVCENAFPKLIKAANEMYEAAAQRAKRADEIAKSYDQLYTSVKKLKADVTNSIASLQAELSRTPRELIEEYIDKDGNQKFKKRPNPEYNAILTFIANENSRLSALKDLSYKVYDDLSYASRVAREMYASVSEIKNAIPEIERYSREITNKAADASYALSRDLEALERYVSFVFSV